MEKGIYAAALTPLLPGFRCDAEALAAHCLDLISRGCKGVVLFGTTGEGASFSLEEKKGAIGKVIANGVDPQKIIIANGSGCLQDTIDLGQAAREQGCLAYLIAPPCFFKRVEEEGVLAFYRAVISQLGKLPILLYHIPQFSGVPLSINIVKILIKEFPNVIGLKESEGNLSFTKAILEAGIDCQVFVGKEKQIPEALGYGASGSICGMANLWPELICSVYETGDVRELEKLAKPIENLPFIPCFKAILAESKGERWRSVVPPLVS